jgi:hypothetical protein
MPDPTVDEVFAQVRTAIETGLAGVPATTGAMEVVPTRYRASFEKRLQTPGAWDRDRVNVLNAAKQLGIIAAAIASLRQETEVTQDVMETAAETVQEECSIGFKEGKWCTVG